MKTCPSCGNRKVQGMICLNCGYDFKKRPLDSSEATDVIIQGPNADIWLGTFSSKKEFEKYFREFEAYGENGPISPFAEEQGFNFYDHDFFVAEYFDKTDDLEKILSGIMVFDERAEGIVARYRTAGIGSINFIALQLEELCPPGEQRSVKGKNYSIHYLGRFRYSSLKD
jgi:hypothetical protein